MANRPPKGCLVFIVVCLLVAGGLSLIPHEDKTDASSIDTAGKNTSGEVAAGEDTAENACEAAQVYATLILVAPSTADFELCSTAVDTTSKEKDGTWTATGYVDAQNVFGAKIRQEYYVKLRYDPSNSIKFKKPMATLMPMPQSQ